MQIHLINISYNILYGHSYIHLKNNNNNFSIVISFKMRTKRKENYDLFVTPTLV